jgi:LysM repeat protein
MKKPSFLTQISAAINARKKKKLHAATRTAPRAAMNEYEADEPTTKLSSAFFVVFILHVVAIGGIYAFNGIKASRIKDQPPVVAPAEKGKSGATHDAKAPVQAGPPASATVSRVAEGAVAVPPVPTVTNPKAVTPKLYQVKAGDNPTKIAIAFGLKTDELLAANNLKDGAILRQGQMLTIPTPKPATKPIIAEVHKADVPAKQTDVPPTRTTPGMHIVKKGDTATSIAKIYGLTAEEILKLNKITDAKKLQLGQNLKIPPKKG